MARILIIDNDPLLLQLLGMHIARNGHEVVPASGAIRSEEHTSELQSH